MGAKAPNPSGGKFNRLLIIRRVEPVVYPYGSYNRVECICDCGNIVTTRESKVLSGWTKSCGCLQREKVVMKDYKHGGSKDNLYVVWCGMKQRCNYKDADNYKWYGGRGIRVCADWMDYAKFRDDMQGSYSIGLTLDRIDNDGDYCKENCRWVTWAEQANNRSNNLCLKSAQRINIPPTRESKYSGICM